MAKKSRNRVVTFLALIGLAFGGGVGATYLYLNQTMTPVVVSTPTEPEPTVPTEVVPVSLEMRPQARTSRIPVIMYHDITPQKGVSFDVTPKRFKQHLEMIQKSGSTPITMDQLEAYLTKGDPLPPKPILLTFDDGYLGQLEYAYPLLKEFKYPAVFYVHTAYVGVDTSRKHMTWEQLQTIQAEGLVSIQSHTVNHPADLSLLSDDQIRRELADSKAILEEKLGQPIRHLCYPTGNRDARVVAIAKELGYHTATTMGVGYVGTSPGMLELNRFGQSQLAQALEQNSGEEDPDLAISVVAADFTKPMSYIQVTQGTVQLSMAIGGKPYTVHGDKRYNLSEYVTQTQGGVAAVTGVFFPLRTKDPTKLIGPVFAQNQEEFIIPALAETGGLDGRPLVLIGTDSITFAPFNRGYLLSESGARSLVPDLQDVFLAGTWLVRGGIPQDSEAMKKVNLASYLEVRHRSFVGVYGDRRFVVGITHNRNNAPTLARALAKAGITEAVLTDSGQSSDLIYRGQSLVQYEARPVPHAIVVRAPIDPLAPPPKLPLATGRP